jgi:glycosyltransferase involved in cell wall biosynthesis
MKISIITAAYNSASTIADTLQSVAGQTHPDKEHIIVDGLSKDNTLAIVSEFPHVAQCRSEKDKGIYDAMNKGLTMVTGDVVAILNSDDFYENEFVLSKVAKAFEDPTVHVVYGDLVYIDPVKDNRITRYWKAGTYTASSFHYGWMPPHPAFFVRRQVYEQLGNFNASLTCSADYEIILRMLLKHRLKAVYLPETMVRMREGGISNASLKHRWRANREDHQAWRLNGLKPYFFTLYLKPFRKIFQFVNK